MEVDTKPGQAQLYDVNPVHTNFGIEGAKVIASGKPDKSLLLHRMARRELARRGGGVTLSATELLHDAYVNISQREGITFPDRNRYMGYACRVMRRLIIDYARTRQAQKRGGHFEITSISTDVADPMTSASVSMVSCQSPWFKM